MSRFRWGLVVWLVAALGTATLMMSAALDHNPQYEFADADGVIDWTTLGGIGVSWFVVIGVIPVVVASSLRGALRLWRRRPDEADAHTQRVTRR